MAVKRLAAVGLAGSIQFPASLIAMDAQPDTSRAMSADFARGIIADVGSGALQLDDAVTQLADRDCAREIAQLIGERVGADAAVVGDALRAAAQEPLAILCRAAGLSANGYSAILRMRRRSGQGLNGSVANLLRAYLSRPKLNRMQIAEALQRLAHHTDERV
jgi:hypothetical protein